MRFFLRWHIIVMAQGFNGEARASSKLAENGMVASGYAMRERLVCQWLHRVKAAAPIARCNLGMM